MGRLNKDRQINLEPLRMEFAICKINEIGFEVSTPNDKYILFYYKGEIITYYPYTGWATGKTIDDGRGLKNLLKQLV